MTSQKGRRQSARSAAKRCKPVKYATREAASVALDQIFKRDPLKALGQRPYWCSSCKHYHTGRSGKRKR